MAHEESPGSARRASGAPSGRSRLVAAREQMYRSLVFETAERLFARSDFERVSMRDIAADCGISPKTLYAVYAGKEEIYRDIKVERSRSLLGRVREAVEPEAAALVRLRRSVRAYVSYLLEHPDFFRILMRESRAWGVVPGGAPESAWRSGHRMQVDLIRQGIAEGVFYDGDADLMAAMGIAIIQVYLAAMLERDASGVDAEAVTAELVLQLERSLRRMPEDDGA